VADSVLAVMPCARLAMLERAFHRPQVERPDTVAALILAFLKGLEPGVESLENRESDCRL
jgi:hypothetical protein